MKSLVLLSFLSACTYSTSYLKEGLPYIPATHHEQVELYVDDLPESHLEVIGVVTAATNRGKKRLIEKLKQEAAKIGAQAVYELRVNFLNAHTDWMNARGVAVKRKTY